jgi:2-oxoisovalerate dehydrogenase E1 component alpha subunit
MNDRISADRSNRPILSLHVPEPPFRPGDEPDFSGMVIPSGGIDAEARCCSTAADTHPLALQLVRVLDEEHRAVGPVGPEARSRHLRKMLRDMATVRIFDDRMYRAQRQGKTSFYMKCTGEEAIAVAAAAACDFEDMHFPTYRQQACSSRAGYPMLKMMFRSIQCGDPLHGRQLPIMYSDKEHGFFSISGNLATQYPQAVGWAMASAIRGDSRNRRRLGPAKAQVRRAIPRRADVRPPSTTRRSSSPSSTISGRSRAFSASPAPSARPLPQRADRLWHRRLRDDGNDALCGHAATRWAPTGRAQPRPDLIEYFSYRAEAIPPRRSDRLPPAARRSMAVGDPSSAEAALFRVASGTMSATAMQSEISRVRKLQKAGGELRRPAGQGFDRIGSMFEDVFDIRPGILGAAGTAGEAREFLGHDVE